MRSNHLRRMLRVQTAMGDWGTAKKLSSSSQAQTWKPFYPVPCLSSTMTDTGMKQLKITVLQYQFIHASLTGPNALLITGNRKKNLWTWHLVETVGHINSLFCTSFLRHKIRNLPSSIISLYFVLLSLISPLQAAGIL